MKVRDIQDSTRMLGEAWEILSQESIDATIKGIGGVSGHFSVLIDSKTVCSYDSGAFYRM